MGFWFLDDKAQLALIMAGLLGAAGASGCAGSRPVPGDARVDKIQVVDRVPEDFRAESRRDYLIADPPPPDARPDRPRDHSTLFLDGMVVDMVPMDASATLPAPKPQPAADPGKSLPLSRGLRAQIVSRVQQGKIELSARCPAGLKGLTYRWRASAGTIERSDHQSTLWIPPTTKGTYIVQLTVRDGDRAISIDVLRHEVK
jgi:hypothetical protein